MGYIRDWNSIPIGAEVIQDTYNEVYTVVERNGCRWLEHTGWQIDRGEPVTHDLIKMNFDPACTYDQPWIRLS